MCLNLLIVLTTLYKLGEKLLIPITDTIKKEKAKEFGIS